MFETQKFNDINHHLLVAFNILVLLNIQHPTSSEPP